MDLRKVQRFVADPACSEGLDDVAGCWVTVTFKELKKGDIFRLFEASGEPDIAVEGGHPQVCVAVGDPYVVDEAKEKNYCVQSLPLIWYS